ncbi:MAG: DUF3467 domain-containing protein [Planctomycetota bacterium]
MADGEQQGQQVPVDFDESKMHSAYANTVRTANVGDAVLMDFGLGLPIQNQGRQGLRIQFGSRVIMNWAGAKNLAMSLGNMIRQYEERFGEINPQGGAPGGASGGQQGGPPPQL